ncbi:MAG: histidinol-phosphate transaminase [Muribaculaceae bacterium]|nr:histidinol-phosphate transaminase [Muribaculaceae bacterium]MDE5844393.1 histidinol-phosphate transaminase [Muribaculaceae bacterium]
MKSDIKALIRPNILALSPYSTARDEYKGKIGVFLDANESPFENGYNRYPDPRQLTLKKRLSEIKRLPIENMFIGNGSDEAIDLMFRIFCIPGEDNAIAIAPSYGMYEVSAAINDVEMRKVLLNRDFSLPTDALLKAADSNSKLLFICSPNNPTGNSFEVDEILTLVKKFDGIVVVDEAYIDFSNKESLTGKLSDYPNLVVLQTMSKAWGMAGLRCGLAFASKEIIDYMNMVKYPYNINLSTIEKVTKLLDEPLDEHVNTIKVERENMSRRLKDFEFVKEVYPSDSNFILFKSDDGDALYNYLIGREIIVRNRSRVALCENCLRLTIGTPEENKRVIEALENYK